MTRDSDDLPGRVSRAEQQKRARAARDKARYERKKAEREAAGETLRGPGRPSDAPAGPNEAAVIEYLRRHPDATAKDVAFHAIYGGGTTAWEGLHRKTQRNASAEASRVLQRLSDKGVVRQSGWTGGGRAKWDITENAPDPDPEKLDRWLGGKTRKGSYGFLRRPERGEEPEPRRRRGGKSYGIGSAASPGDDEPDKPKGGGKSYGITSPASRGDDEPDDDNGGGHGVFRGF